MKKEQVHEEQSNFQRIEIWDIYAGPSMIWGEFDASERWLLLDGVHQVGQLNSTYNLCQRNELQPRKVSVRYSSHILAV